MSVKMKYLPLPGVNFKDPDFYEEHGFFAEGPHYATSPQSVPEQMDNGNLDTDEPASESGAVPWKNMRSK